MTMPKRFAAAGALALALVITGAACDGNVEDDLENVGENVEEGVEDVGDAVEEGASELQDEDEG